MASKKARTKRVAYNANIQLSFDYDNGRIEIPTNRIAYVYIDNNYESNVLPTLYMSLLVTDDLYTVLSTQRSTGTFTLLIKKFLLNSSTTAMKTILNDTFTYVLSNNATNFMEDLNKESPNQGKDKYRRILIGLISKTMTNKLRQSYNGIYNNINESTIVAMALEGTNPVIENLQTNKKYESLVIPPTPTRYQLLRYVFDKDPFYDMDFILFMDFDKTYLLSKNGRKVDSGDGKPNSVIINISSITSQEAFFEGLEIANDHYYLDIAPTDIQIQTGESLDKAVDNITVINEDNEVSNVDIDYPDQTQGLTSKNIYIRSNNPTVMKNSLELGQVRVKVVKSYIDGSVFTPNKTYNITNYGGNSKYNGLYILESKQIIFKPMVNDFQMSVVLGLRKVGKLNQVVETKSGKNKYVKDTNKSVKPTAKRTTTAALKKQANVRRSN